MVFFFKQKTAYEMLRSLVGSEMCIRDRYEAAEQSEHVEKVDIRDKCMAYNNGIKTISSGIVCLLYTSDAADDLLCVDLGGRRIIKKKKQTRHSSTPPLRKAITDHYQHQIPITHNLH